MSTIQFYEKQDAYFSVTEDEIRPFTEFLQKEEIHFQSPRESGTSNGKKVLHVELAAVDSDLSSKEADDLIRKFTSSLRKPH